MILDLNWIEETAMSQSRWLAPANKITQAAKLGGFRFSFNAKQVNK
jgi:hypothetical protein